MMTAALIIARLTLRRLSRQRGWIVTLLLLAFGPLIATVARRPEPVLAMVLKLPVILAPAMLLAPALAEELELKTHTYLWSRPVPRFAVILGKLMAVTPLLAAAFALSLTVSWAIADRGHDVALLGRAILASTLAGAAAGALAAGAGTLFTRRPLVFVLAYLLIGEQLLQFVPVLQKLSIAYYAWAVAGLSPPGGHRVLAPISPAGAALGLCILGGVWLALGAWRVSRGEYATADQ